MRDFGYLCALALGVALLFWLVLAVGWWINTAMMEAKCRQDNNVNACFLQYVPEPPQ